MSRKVFRVTVVAAMLSIFVAVTPARAQSAENVLLVVNDASPVSARIAEHYARARSVPQDNRVHIKVDAKDEVSRGDYERLIETPIAQWLTRNFAQDRILFIVLTKGVPLRILGTAGRSGTVASVDSELTLLYRKLTGAPAPLAGQVANPYFLGEAPIAQAKPFSRQDYDIYLVTRLDGFTLDDVLGEIDRAAAPSREGVIVLDGKAAWDDVGNKWLQATVDRLEANGMKERVVLDTTSRVITSETDVLGYYSWGSTDPAIKVRSSGVRFAPGALAAMFVSTDARTFDEPPAGWQVGNWNDRKTFFANSPQSLTGDLIREGATGAAGHVAEPYFDATIRPNVLFPAYLSGFTLAESFYLAMPYLSWQTIVVGDPLCAPFPRKPLSGAATDRGLDPSTELPTNFSTRRLQVLVAANRAINSDALKMALRAEAKAAQQDQAGAQAALEEATTLDGRLNMAHLALASIYEQKGEYDKAIDRYRRMVGNNPSDAIALNNLAYSLAARKSQPDDALPFAQRAFALSPANPIIIDTLGWVQHLLGNQAEAGRLLAAAARALPSNPEVRFHLAAALAATGALDPARRELAEALKLDPELERRDEVKQLQAQLKR